MSTRTEGTTSVSQLPLMRELLEVDGEAPKGTPPAHDRQEIVTRHFDHETQYWNEIYRQNDLYARIHQRRSAAALHWIDQFELPAGASVLEIGCGAGLMAIALAQRGYRVQATDSSTMMLELARQNAEQAGVSNHILTAVADAHRLNYPDQSFDVVIALGVTPFLYCLPAAIREMSRVLRPGGRLITNADHRWRLHTLLDPHFSPLLAPIRQLVKKAVRRVKDSNAAGQDPPVYMYSRRHFDSIVTAAGFDVVHSYMFGFGPFSFLGRELPDSLGVKVDRLLQAVADRRAPVLRALGAQYMILGEKPVPLSFHRDMSQAPGSQSPPV